MIKSLKHIFSSQKGAMFGMDARIALGAFAALAVIVGYQITSRVSMAEYGTILKEMRAVETAMMNMQADMGVFYEFAVDGSGTTDIRLANIYALYDISHVKDNFQSKWTGPYLDKDPEEEGFIRVRRESDSTVLGPDIMHAHANVRDADPTNLGTSTCNLNNECYMWLRRLDIPNEYFVAINEIVDEQGGETPETNPREEGRIRSNPANHLIYRTEVVRRP